MGWLPGVRLESPKPAKTLTKQGTERDRFVAAKSDVNALPLNLGGTRKASRLQLTLSQMFPSTGRAVADDRRVAQARLQIVVDSLKMTMVFNPLFALTAALLLGAPHSPMGPVPLWRLSVGMGGQLCGAALAAYLLRRFRDVRLDQVAWLGNVLLGAQVLFSGWWGAISFLYWVPGNELNHIYVTMVMAIAVYSVVFARSMHIPIMLTAMAVQCGLFFLRLMSADGAVATTIALMLPVYLFYLWFMGQSSNRRIETAIAARFANQDLAVQLSSARDEALRKRYEAETANATKTAFLANMSHELRTPLNAILGFSDIIASKAMGTRAVDRYAEYARDIHDSGSHLLSLINDLLDIAKIEAGKMEIELRPVDPRHVAEGAARLIRPRADAKGQAMAAEIAEALPPLLADERALRQMLLNLLSNAVKFTPLGGKITISCRPWQDGVQFCVADNGQGIPADKLSHVFEPFSQIDNRFDREAGGTGLGLALVQGLARLHGGRTWLESPASGGTNAFIYLPARSEGFAGSTSLTALG